MKKAPVLIPIIAVLIVSVISISLLYNQEIKLGLGMMTSDEKPDPAHIPDPICFAVGRATLDEKESAGASEVCFPLNNFQSLGCDRLVLGYIYKNTNLLDKGFDDVYLRNSVGLPEGISEEEYEECADSIYEKRKTMSEKMEFESFSIVEGTKIHLEGVIMDMRLGPDHQYSFFTNDPRYTFNTGSEGIALEGINDKDDLHGKIVSLSGMRTQRDLGIKVDDLVVTGSLIPSPEATAVLTAKDILDVSLDDLYENPDQYYNRSVRIAGKLSEYEDDIAYAGVGCDTAKYTTSDEFVSDFPSSRHLHDGDKTIGIRIGTSDDLGKVKEPLSDELKTNKVTVAGIFVPSVVERGDCDHVIHKSGFLLTNLEDIEMDGWTHDDRVLLGCTGDRVPKCYPVDPKEYRSKLHDYYFGKDGLPSSGDYDFASLHTINACTDKPWVCYGEFDNGTKIRVSCDYPIHGCGVKSFGNYTENENEN